MRKRLTDLRNEIIEEIRKEINAHGIDWDESSKRLPCYQTKCYDDNISLMRNLSSGCAEDAVCCDIKYRIGRNDDTKEICIVEDVVIETSEDDYDVEEVSTDDLLAILERLKSMDETERGLCENFYRNEYIQ